MKRKIAAVLAAALVVGGLTFGVASAASAAPNGNDGKVCENLDTGHIEPGTDASELVITAPEGKLIAEVCVKAGSVKKGNGPVYTEYDPAVESVTISHPSGKDISHYAVRYDVSECLVDETHTELTWDVETWQTVTPAIPAVPASIKAGWYTESDDVAPTVSDAGLTFTAPGGKAVGLRYTTSIPLEDVTGESYTEVLHDRAVLDADGTPFSSLGLPAWRDDYTSLTFLSADTVYVSGLNVTMTLAEVQAAYDGTITSFGYHMDSNAVADTVATLSAADAVDPGQAEVPAVLGWVKTGTGQGLALPVSSDAVRYVQTGTVEVTEQVPGECPLPLEEEVVPTETPEPTTPPVATETPAPVAAPAAANVTPVASELADTGVDGVQALIGLGGFLLLVGAAIFVIARVRKGTASE
jgi:hypothetical protein